MEKALESFEGTILCVSHDRYFVNKLATKILYFAGTGVAVLDGNYDDYASYQANAVTADGMKKEEKKPNAYQLRKEAESRERKRKTRMKRIEEELGAAEAERDALNALLSDPDNAADYEKIIDLTARLEAINGKIEALESEWLELEEI